MAVRMIVIMMMAMLRGKRWTVVSICGKGRGKPGEAGKQCSPPIFEHAHSTAGHDHHDHLDDDIDCEGKEDGSQLTIPVL